MRFLPLCLPILAISMVEAMPLGKETTSPVWGEWSPLGECSRSCGSGVFTQQRQCITDCTSEVETRYQSCCVQDCPETTTTTDFLQEQCGELQPSGNWTLADVDEDNVNDDCTLHCQDITGKEDDVLILAAPGTPCRTGQEERGVCLGKQCIVLGCDGVLGSGQIEDGCLQCVPADNGISSRCHAESDTVERSPLITGSVPFLDIPESATSLRISHPLDRDEGRLVLKGSKGYAFLRGNTGTEFEVLNVTFQYEIFQDSGTNGFIEQFTARGPLAEPIRVELQDVIMGTNPTVSYTYYKLSAKEDHTPEAPPPHTIHSTPLSSSNVYMWEYMSSSECSVSCGHGVMMLVAMCVDEEYPDRQLADEICSAQGLVKPFPFIQPCHLQDCPAVWTTDDWSLCSQECGRGLQTRHVECRQYLEGVAVPVNSSACDSKSRPEDELPCNKQPCLATWVTGAWSQCSEEIYEGVQYRTVHCEEVATGDVTDHTHCSVSSKPDTARICRLANCEDGECYRWSPQEWSECDESCGYGRQTRSVVCHDGEVEVNVSLCAGLKTLAGEQSCYSTQEPSCNVHWLTEDYGKCSGNCCDSSQQMKHRTVECVAIRDNITRISFPDTACDTPKPATSAECERSDCAYWHTSPWGECSTSCEETGVQEREVTCVGSDGEETDWRECCVQQPVEAAPCNEVPCSPCDQEDLEDDYDGCMLLVSEIEMDSCPLDSFWQQLCAKTCCMLNER